MIRLILGVDRVEVASRGIRLEGFEIVSLVLVYSLIVEAQTCLIHKDYILPVSYPKAASAGEMEYCTARLPRQIPVTILAANVARFGDIGAKFANLARRLLRCTPP